MGLELAKHFISIGADASKLKPELTAVQDSVMESFGRLSGRISALVGGLFATAGISILVKQSFDAIESLDKMARQLRITTETMSIIDFTSKQTGISVEKLTKMFKKGQGDFRPFIERARELGLILSRDMAERVKSANRAVSEFFSVVRGGANVIAAGIAPIVKVIAKGMTEIQLRINEVFKNAAEYVDFLLPIVKKGMDFVVTLFDAFLNAADAVEDAIIRIFDAVFPGLLENSGGLIGLLITKMTQAVKFIENVFITTVQTLESVIMSVITPIQHVIQGLMMAAGARTAWDLLKRAAIGLAVPLVGLASTLGLIVAKAALVGTAVSLAFDTIHKLVVTNWDVIKTILDTLGKAVSNVMGFLTKIVSNTLNFFSTMWKRNGEHIVATFKLAIEITMNFYDTVIAIVGAITAGFASLFNFIGSMFPKTFGDATMEVEHFFLVIGHWIHQLLDWISLMSTNWELTWELMKTNAALALAIVGDKALMVFNTIKASLIATVYTSIQLAIDMGKTIVAAFERVSKTIQGLFKGLWEGIKNKFQGGDFLGPFRREFTKQMMQIESEFPDMLGNASKTFTEKFTENMGEDSPLAGLVKDLEDRAENIKEQMKAEREQKRKQRDAVTLDIDLQGADSAMEIKGADKMDKAAEAMIDASRLFLDDGRYGFAELGTSIQDAFLKRGDPALMTNQLLGENNRNGKAVVDELKKVNENIKDVGVLT